MTSFKCVPLCFLALPIPGREAHGNLHLPLWISAIVSVLVVLIVVVMVILKKRQVGNYYISSIV